MGLVDLPPRLTFTQLTFYEGNVEGTSRPTWCLTHTIPQK